MSDSDITIPPAMQHDVPGSFAGNLPSDLPFNMEATDSEEQEPSSLEKRTQLHDQTLRLSFPRLIASYLCLCACYFISYLDMNSTTTALPTISNALSAGTTITWAGTAFLLGQTTFQPLYGRISDITGRKPVLLASIGCLFLGDLLSGLARNPLWLYLTRAIGGIGAGGISSLVAIIVSDLVSLKERGKYQGFISISIGAGAMTGPFVAASLVQRQSDGWRWVFWVPSILAFICMVVLYFVLSLRPVEGSWKEKADKIDWWGVFASVTGIVLLLIPINSGGNIWEWHSALIIVLITLGSMLLIFFVLAEATLAKIPIMPLWLFKKRSLAIMLISGGLHDYVWQATQYFMPLYFQEVRGYSPLMSAILILPCAFATSFAGALSGPLMSRFARYSPILRSGLIIWTVGVCLNLLFNQSTHIAVYVVVLAIQGLGIGLTHQPGLVAVQALARNEDRAVATSTRNLLRSLGSVFGIAISTAAQYAAIKSALHDKGPLDILSEVLNGSWETSATTSMLYRSTVIDAKMEGFRVVFITLIPLIFLCAFGNFFVADTMLKGDLEGEDRS